jgi:predicted dehydrogenase
MAAKGANPLGQTTTRRFFMGAVTAAAATRVWGANEKINIGIIGLGGRGGSHMSQFPRIANVIGVCDIDQAAREKAVTNLTRNGAEKPKDFEDLRDLLGKGGVDAVSIATPNHWHALAAIWAMKAGKDVYGEKPACHNIHEGLEMVKVARENKRIMQVGSQHRSTPFKMKAIEALQGGLIGKIYLAKGLCYKRRDTIGKKPDSPVPAGVNWDIFRGPAPMRPFNENRFKYKWHWFWDTGNGDIGNQGVHEMGIARWALGDPEWPKTAYAFGGKYAYDDDQETPNTLTSSFDFGGREIVFEVRGLLTGGEGAVGRMGMPPGGGPGAARGRGAAGTAPAGGPPANAPTPGTPAAAALNVMVGDLFYGTEGWASMNDQGFIAYKGESNEIVLETRPERGSGDATGAHMQNFLDACKSRNPKDLHDPIDNAHLSAALCHFANISYRTGRKLHIEAGPKFAGDAEANKMLTRDYRKGYVV